MKPKLLLLLLTQYVPFVELLTILGTLSGEPLSLAAATTNTGLIQIYNSSSMPIGLYSWSVLALLQKLKVGKSTVNIQL